MDNMFDKGFRLVKEIKALEKDSTAYIVGGAVRDFVLGRECDDIDIVTSVDIDIIEKHYPTHDIGSNKDFGILVVEFEGEVFEIANYREDGEYSDGRRPDDVKIVADFETDSKRRDFTINAMAMDEDKNIIDYHNGQEDLKNGIIRTVGEAKDRFEEDFLRMFRAIRFATVLNFKLDNDVRVEIAYMNGRIMDVSTERLWKEFWKMANSDNFAFGIHLMDELGILEKLLPEITDFKNYDHYKQHHPEGCVWKHVMGVIAQLDDKPAVVKLGGLFHDIGKPAAYEWFPNKGENGKYHYIKHDIIGLDVFDKVVDRFHIPKDIANEIRYCIKGHMRMHLFLNMRDSKCIKLIDSPYWKSLYDVAHADDRARLYCYDWYFWKDVDEKVERLQVILDNQKSVNSIVDGVFVMDILGVKGGRIVGETLKKARAYIIDKKVDVTTEDGYNRIKKYVSTFK